MTKEMIISSSAHETRVAILEDDQIAEMFIERERQRGVAGNLYKGRVSKVLPGMQSAFVDLGLERDGFLYVSDVTASTEEFDRLETEDDEPSSPATGNGSPHVQAADDARGTSTKPEKLVAADRNAALVRVLAAQGAAAGAIGIATATKAPNPRSKSFSRKARKSSFRWPKNRLAPRVPVSPATPPCQVDSWCSCRRSITSAFHGRSIRATSAAGCGGLSANSANSTDFTGGVIIRTAAAGRPKEDIVSDLSYFHRVWTDIRQKSESSRAPAVVYQEQSLVAKLLRDLLTEEFSAIRIDNDLEYRRVCELVERIMPALAPRVRLYEKEYPILEEYGVQAEIDRALRSKVWLKSGGSIVINQTEALVAIDVNTGRYVGKKTAGRLEDTILKTNLEAVKEIVRQIRLRDLGGIIVLDFIDMEEKKNRQKVFQAVEQELRKDRAPSKTLQVSDFGLVIITRKRVKQSLERVLTEPCPYCAGSAVIKSSSTICYEILSEVKKISSDLDGQTLVLRVNPDIARALREEERAVFKDLKQSLGREVTVRPDVQLHHEQFDLMAVG